jgi:gliding motility-associated-like protein
MSIHIPFSFSTMNFPLITGMICTWLMFFQQQNLFATHAAGADLTYKCLGGLTYEIEATFYRDCSGSSEPGNVTIRYSSLSCGYNQTVIATKRLINNGTEITLPCATAPSSCTTGMSTGIRKWVYVAVVTLPAACSDWVFSYRVCCRNCSITTIQNPCSAGSEIYVESRLNNLLAPCNNSPYFSTLPIAFVCIGQNFSYNQGVIDVDNDSLAYDLITPMTSATGTVNWLPPNNTQSPIITSTPFSINPFTGDMNFTPSANQIGILAIRIREFRNGQLIGSTIRDLQVYTQFCTGNTIPTISGINGTNNFSINACAGQQLCFSIQTHDPDPAQVITVSSVNPIVNSTLTQTNTNRPQLQFCWTPELQDVSTIPKVFTVSVRDNACPVNGIQTYSFSINVSSPSYLITSTNNSCAGINDGSAAVIPVQGNLLNCTWNTNPPQNNLSVSSLPAGTYIATISNQFGCVVMDTVSVTEPAAINLQTSITNVDCHGVCNGAIQASATANTSLLWSTGETTSGISRLCAGTYTITVTDQSGCSLTESMQIQSATAMTASVSVEDVACNGVSNGEASINISGGEFPYHYMWSNGSTTQSVQNLAHGNYQVTVTDNNGCSIINQVTIGIRNDTMAVSSNVNDVTCYGNINGSVNIEVTGGTQPYTYMWNHGAVTQNLNNLSAGNYTVTITDLNGCSTNRSINVDEPDSVSAVITSYEHVKCHGDNSGFIILGLTGGTGPYLYAWSNGSTTKDLTGIPSGFYQNTVQDAHGCSSTISFTIHEPASPLNASAGNLQMVSCNGNNNGAISLAIQGGTSPYNFLWSTGVTTGNLTGLSAGNYGYSVTDANGCSYNGNVVITQPDQIQVVSQIQNAGCSMTGNGSATLTVTGGTAPYNYLWNNGSTTAAINSLSAGLYSVTVTDASGCTVTNSFEVSQGSAGLTIEEQITNINCANGTNGSVNVQITGGTGPFIYVWNTGQTAQQISVTDPGQYTVTVTDASGCSVSATFSVLDDTNIKLKNDSVLKVCSGEMVTLSTDSLPGFTYQWYYGNTILNGAISHKFITPAAGIYYVKVKNSCGEYISDTVEVKVESVMNASVSNPQIICPPQQTRLFAQGGVQYTWSPVSGLDDINSSEPVASPDVSTTYSVHILNDAGCSIVLTIPVIVACDSLLVPTGFSPNADGTNDGYVIDGIENYPGNKLWVYDRWGSLVYKKQEYSNTWDGVSNITGMSMGQKLPVGTYFYILDLGNGEKPKAGFIVLRR